MKICIIPDTLLLSMQKKLTQLLLIMAFISFIIIISCFFFNFTQLLYEKRIDAYKIIKGGSNITNVNIVQASHKI